jgi:hypothetical protein
LRLAAPGLLPGQSFEKEYQPDKNYHARSETACQSEHNTKIKFDPD